MSYETILILGAIFTQFVVVAKYMLHIETRFTRLETNQELILKDMSLAPDINS